MKNKTIAIVLLILGPSIILRAFAMDILLPCIPAIAEYFQAEFATSQWVLSLYFFGAGFGQLFMGPLADEYGRRKILLASSVILIVASALCSVAPSIYWLVFFRFLQGLGASGTTDATMAILRDIYDDKTLPKVYSYFNSIVALAPLIAPLLGASILMKTNSWQTTFYFVVAFSIVTLLINYFYVRETSPDLSARKTFFHVDILKSYKIILIDQKFLSYTFCAVMAFSSLFLFFSTSSILMIQIGGMSADVFGYYFAANSIAFIIGNILSPRIIDHSGINKTILIGSCIIILGAFAMLISDLLFGLTTLGLMIPNMLATVGIGLILGPCMAGVMHKYKHIAGIASAVYGALLYGVSSLIVAIVMQLEASDAKILAITMGIMALANVLVIKRIFYKRFATSH
jgi:Bcr/CflA subfamily drug resistance transporter